MTCPMPPTQQPRTASGSSSSNGLPAGQGTRDALLRMCLLSGLYQDPLLRPLAVAGLHLLQAEVQEHRHLLQQQRQQETSPIPLRTTWEGDRVPLTWVEVTRALQHAWAPDLVPQLLRSTSILAGGKQFGPWFRPPGLLEEHPSRADAHTTPWAWPVPWAPSAALPLPSSPAYAHHHGLPAPWSMGRRLLPPVQAYCALERAYSVRGHFGSAFNVLFNTHATLLFTGGDDNLIKVWDVTSGFLVHSLRGHASVTPQHAQTSILDLALSWDDAFLASASDDNTVIVWSLGPSAIRSPPASTSARPPLRDRSATPPTYDPARRFHPLVRLPKVPKGITTISFAPHPHQLVLLVTCQDNQSLVYRWDGTAVAAAHASHALPTVAPVSVKCGTVAKDVVRCSTFNGVGSLFATGGHDSLVYIYHVPSPSRVERAGPGYGTGAKGQSRPIAPTHASSGKGPVLTTDGAMSADSGARAGLPNPYAPILLRVIQAHQGNVHEIEFSNLPTNDLLSCSKDGTTGIHRFQEETLSWTTTLLSVPDAPGLEVIMCCWNADDTLVVTFSSDHRTRIWDAREGTLLLTLANHADMVYNLRAHPTDPRILLTAGHDGRLFLLDISARTPEEAVLKCFHLDDALLCAAFAEDGSHIAVTDSIGVMHLFQAHLPPRDVEPNAVPLDQFFETDWNRVMLEGGELMDELEHRPPHLVPLGQARGLSGLPVTGHQEWWRTYQLRIPPADLLAERCKRVGYLTFLDVWEGAADGDGPAILPAPMPVRKRRRAAGDSEDEEYRETIAYLEALPADLNISSGDEYAEGMEGSPHGANRSGTDPGASSSDADDDVSGSGASEAYDLHIGSDDEEDWLEGEGSGSRPSRARPRRGARTTSAATSSTRSPSGRSSRNRKRRASERSGSRAPKRQAIRTSGRGRSRRIVDSDDDEEEEVPSTPNSSASRYWRRNRGRTQVEEDENEDEEIKVVDGSSEEDVPTDELVEADESEDARATEEEEEDEGESDSEAYAPRRLVPAKKRATPVKRSPPKRRAGGRGAAGRQPVTVHLRSPPRAPSAWVTDASGRPHPPYLPQIGDMVVYFKRGHQEALDALHAEQRQRHANQEDLAIFAEDPRAKGSLIRPPVTDQDVTFGIVEDIRFTPTSPSSYPHLSCVLEIHQHCPASHGSESPAGVGALLPCFSNNHRMCITVELVEGFLGYVLLFSDYVRALALARHAAYSVGDEVRVQGVGAGLSADVAATVAWVSEPMVDWHPLTIRRAKGVRGSGNVLPCNLWQVRPANEVGRRKQKGAASPPGPQPIDAEMTAQAQELVQGALEDEALGFFVDPVDYVAYPTYLALVPYPMCLSLIQQRLANGFYRSVEVGAAIAWDVQVVFENAIRFNEPSSEVYNRAHGLLPVRDALMQVATAHASHAGAVNRWVRKRKLELTALEAADAERIASVAGPSSGSGSSTVHGNRPRSNKEQHHANGSVEGSPEAPLTIRVPVPTTGAQHKGKGKAPLPAAMAAQVRSAGVVDIAAPTSSSSSSSLSSSAPASRATRIRVKLDSAPSSSAARRIIEGED